MSSIDVEKEISDLKTIINNVFGVDLNRNIRKRPFVNSRIIYSKILKDRGYGYIVIGKSLNKDHSTIIHYVQQFERIMYQDEVFAKNYIMCKDAFLKDNPFLTDILSNTDIISQLVSLSAENRKLILERDKVLKTANMYRRLKRVIEFIDINTPEGKEYIAENRIKFLLNGK